MTLRQAGYSICFSSLAVMFSDPVYGGRPELDNVVRIIYMQSQWNDDVKEKDHGIVVIRDAHSGRFAVAHLTETAPNSNLFAGRFYISWAAMGDVIPEVYDPPKEKVLSKEGLEGIPKMIERKEISRKPFVLVKDIKGGLTLEVFEQKEAAKISLELSRQEAALARKVAVNTSPSDEEEAAWREVRTNIRQERNQLRNEQLFIQNRKRTIEVFERRKPENQTARIEKAKELATSAMAFYQAGNFAEAETLFKEALLQNPAAGELYFQLGATQFRLQKYPEALINMRTSFGPQVNPAERGYFAGMILQQMNQRINSLRMFHEVRQMNVESMSASAAFYEGVMLMGMKEYDHAKEAFQYVLDHSTDAQLDAAAEAYIEQIAALTAFETEKRKKFFITGVIGTMYDSNVLTVSDSSRTNTLATNTEGYRTLFSANGEWRPIYNVYDEVAAKVGLTGMYTVASDFKERTSLQKADPLLLSVYGAYRRKGTVAGIAVRSELSPGFEKILMAIEKNRDTPIMDSLVGKWNNMVVLSDRVILMPNGEIRKDSSLLVSAEGDNDSSAMRYSGSLGSIFLVGAERNKMITLDLGMSINAAEGKNFNYTRHDAGTSYSHPWFSGTTWNWRVAYYKSVYTDLTTPRTENNYTGTSTIIRPIDSTFAASSAISYTMNQSNDVDRKYNKFSILLSLVAQGVF